MRATKFRGKSKVNVNYLLDDEPLVKIGEWVYGSLVFDNADNHHIHTLTRRGWEFVIVEAESIGQFTGLLDKNGKEIYEGDIIQGEYNHKHLIRYTEEDARFTATLVEFVGRKEEGWNTCGVTQKWINEFGKVIIGNIHDNPELIKELC